MTLKLPRRRFLTGLAGLIAAPAIVRAESLMKVAAVPLKIPLRFRGIPIRETDELAFLEGMQQQIVQTLIYGDGTKRRGVLDLLDDYARVDRELKAPGTVICWNPPESKTAWMSLLS